MLGGPRTAVVALLTVCIGAWTVVPARMAAQIRPVEIKTVQGVGALPGEPPLVEGAVPGLPGAGAANDPPVPVVAVRVRVPSTASPGQELTYHIYVDNISKATAHRVELRASLPTNARLVSVTPEPDRKEPELHWTFGTMEACASKEITLIVEPDGKGEVRTAARVLFEHGQSVVTHMNKPSVRVKQSGPADGAVNSTLTYALDVVNDGSAVAENIVVTVGLPEGLTFSDSNPPNKGENPLRWEFPSLAPGQRQHIEYKVIPIKQDTFVVSPKVTAAGEVSDSTMATILIGQPKLTIVKSGPRLAVRGQPITYTITVKNTGNVAATNVEVADALPQNMQPQSNVAIVEFLSATGGGRYERPDVRWRVGSLPAGESRSVQMTLRVSQLGRLHNIARVRSEQTLLEKAPFLTLIVNPNDRLTLDIEKSNEEGLIVNGEYVYVVRVINPANVPIEGVALTLSATDNVQFLDARGSTNGKLDGMKPFIQFEPLARLAPGEIREYLVTVRAAKVGEVKFSASAAVNPAILGFPVVKDDITRILAAPPR